MFYPPHDLKENIDHLVRNNDCFNPYITSRIDTLYNYNYIPTDETQIKHIRVNLQVIQDENGQNNFQENNPDHLQYLNNIFSETWNSSVNGIYANIAQPVYEGTIGDYHIEDSRIRFSLENINFHQDNGGLNGINGSGHFSFIDYCDNNFGVNMDTEINIFLIPRGYHAQLGNTKVGGVGPAGGSNTTPAYIGRVVMYNIFYDFEETGGAHWIVNPLIGHELGHVLGLGHTFIQSEYNRFYPELFWPETSSWCSPASDTHCSNNMMGYNSTKSYLSPKQIGHIHRVFSSNPARTRYLKSCEYNPENTFTLSENSTWEMASVTHGDLIIPDGITLEITCMLSMPNNSKIIIQPGAKLIVDGGIITNSCGDYWQGIYVEGNRTLPQTAENQGTLILKNGAIIENARTAVHVRGVDDNWWGNGGIVQANDAQFINNWRNVEFNAYQNTNSHGEEIRNVSYFTDVDFITNDQTLHNEHISNVTLWGVKGVRFISCEFTDNRTNIDFIASNKARNGILTSSASFYVSSSGFTNMKYGIYANSNASGHSFRVQNSNFSSYRGIYFNATDNVILLGNDFTVAPGYSYSSDAGRCDETYGVYINNSSNFVIEDNDFVSSSNGSTTCGSVGIVARSTGSHTNELYRNDFEGFTVGIEAIGENRGDLNSQGLELQCNRLEDGAWDFYIDYDVTARGVSGIRELQGYPTGQNPEILAGNLFGNDSPILVSNFVNKVRGSSISYFHHDPASESRIVPSIHSGRPAIYLFQSDGDFSYDDVCPQNLHPKSLDELVAEKQDAQTHYEETSVLLQAHVDDGNTELMSQQVEMAGEGDAYNTYQYLIQTSPYLSEEVLTLLGAKEEGFNNAMIRDVLVENPQAAKSEEVNLALDSRIDQLPAYMRWQINNGLTQFSEKEIMEQFLVYQKTRHDQALNEIIRGIVHNKEGFENAPPLDQLLAQVDDVRYQYMRAELKFAEEDYAAGLQQLNLIAQQYDLSDANSLQAHQDKTDFYTLLTQWSNHEDHPGFTNLPAEVLLQLENYLEATPRVAGKALSLLMLNEAIAYEEPILYPQEDMLPKTDPVSGPDEFMVPDMDSELSFSLYPNPSRDYLTLDWCIESPRLAESGRIEFRNATGVLVHTMATHIPCNQQIVPLDGWKSGTYTATLTLNNQLRKTITFVVAK